MDDSWSPWKLTPWAMVFVILVVLVITTAIANWSRHDHVPVTLRTEDVAAGSAAPAIPSEPAPVASARSSTRHLVASVAECNRYAAHRVGYRDRTVGVLTDGTIDVPTGGGSALYGLNEHKKDDERYRRAYASCMRSRGTRADGGAGLRP